MQITDAFPSMKTLLAALIAGVVAVGSPAFAQDKKVEPTSEELKKAEAKKAGKAEKSEAKKDQGKKKIKKGGC